MELTGTIKQIGETKEFGSKGFRKRELVLTTGDNPEYPQHVAIDFTQDKTEVLNKYKVSQLVTISINIQGREWQDPKTKEVKHFNSIVGWKIDSPQQADSNADMNDGFETTTDNNNSSDSDDLPF